LLLVSALAYASAERLDFLSLAPRQNLLSFAERLVMPCGLYLLAFRQDLGRIQAPDSGEATATGQFILIRRAIYDHVGGHAAVRTDICEDVALARLVKRAGWRVMLADGERLLSTRMYDGWRSLWIGVSKNLVDMLGGSISTVATAVAGVVLAWSAILAPLMDAIGCARARDHACLALAIALPPSASAFGLHLAGAAFFRIPFWYGLLFPMGYTAGALMALDSVRRRATGRISWKGRTYP
jgi:chlorobactene glucosyltransferase